MARCEDCTKAYPPLRGNGSCPLGRTLQGEHAQKGEHECLFFKGREVIASARKARKRDAPQEGLF